MEVLLVPPKEPPGSFRDLCKLKNLTKILRVITVKVELDVKTGARQTHTFAASVTNEMVPNDVEAINHGEKIRQTLSMQSP